MTKLLQNAFEQLKLLPEDLQDKVATHLLQYVDEISEPPEPNDRAAIQAGREDFRRGNFILLDESYR